MTQRILCRLFLLTGRCEPMVVTPPLPEAACAALAERTRRRKTKFIMAYCTGAAT